MDYRANPCDNAMHVVLCRKPQHLGGYAGDACRQPAMLSAADGLPTCSPEEGSPPSCEIYSEIKY
jgi:hypothetical protein